MLLAGLDLDQLRNTEFYRKLPPSTAALAEPLQNASYVLVASSGNDLTAIARGTFREPPAGSELITSQLAIMGSPASIRVARAQYRSRTIAVGDMLYHARPLAAQHPVWAVVRGAATLPLTGNLANLNRFLHSTDYTTASARVTDTLSLNLVGICRTADEAQHLERTLRAFLSLATLRSQGKPAHATIATEQNRVTLSLTVDPSDAGRLLRE
jgi:hypothetical protein